MSLSVSITIPKGKGLKGVLQQLGAQVGNHSDEAMEPLMQFWQRDTIINWPVDTGFSRSSITTPHKVGKGVWRFEVTANYARVIEYGGYRGVGPKTHQVGAHSLPGGIEINEGIYVTQRPTAPMRRAQSEVKLRLNEGQGADSTLGRWLGGFRRR